MRLRAQRPWLLIPAHLGGAFVGPQDPGEELVESRGRHLEPPVDIERNPWLRAVGLGVQREEAAPGRHRECRMPYLDPVLRCAVTVPMRGQARVIGNLYKYADG